jgi:hypothetical protein
MLMNIYVVKAVLARIEKGAKEDVHRSDALRDIRTIFNTFTDGGP